MKTRALLALLLLLSACKQERQETQAGQTPKAPRGTKIALLLPEAKTSRYESHDRPNFERKLQSLFTGQDAELAAIQRIIAGEQFMTVYKAIKVEAETAAELAVALARGDKPPAGTVNGRVNNGLKDVPSVLLTPVAVTKANVQATVLADDFWTVEQLCVGGYQAACTQAGIH